MMSSGEFLRSLLMFAHVNRGLLCDWRDSRPAFLKVKRRIFHANTMKLYLMAKLSIF